MKTCSILALVFALFPFVANAQQSDSKAVLASFIRFVWEAKQEEAAAVVFSKPDEKIATFEKIKLFIKHSKEYQNSPIEIVESKEMDTVAWIIVKDAVKRPDGKPDYDGVLMVKREAVWKVVLKANEVEDDPRVIDAKERKSITELKAWQNDTIKLLSK
jgi:hypothetical protein